MSSKHDKDNRSNQLNPNHDVYYSSRGSSRYESDDDDQDYRQPAAVASFNLLPDISRSATYGFGAVAMSGKAIYVTANFHATARLSASDPDRDCQHLFEEYLEGFSLIAHYHLKSLLQGELALFTVFDPSLDRLPWHAPLMANNLEGTRELLHLDKCEFVSPMLKLSTPASATTTALNNLISAIAGGPPKTSTQEKQRLNPEPFINALRNEVNSDAVCIGEYQVPYNGKMSSKETNSISQQLAELRR